MPEANRRRMFQSIRVTGYRGFSRYAMEDLGRVNLLVGRNNSGKTAVLEAAYVLGAAGDPAALWHICNRRGERVPNDPDRQQRDVEAAIAHLFAGHDLVIDQSFSVEGTGSRSHQAVTVAVEDLSTGETSLLPSLSLRIRATAVNAVHHVPLTREGGLELSRAELLSRPPGRPSRERPANIYFISTESMSGNDLIRHWDRIQLSPDEELVHRAMRFVDPSVERIRSFAAGGAFGPRGGFIVKRTTDSRPVPIGSLGDGAWRMLTLAIMLTQCAGGMICIDEIDTGLHHTVMADMWRLIQAAAKEFDIQVFASTHSYDCVHSLATICRDTEDADNEVTIQRIEAGKPAATPFSEAEIRIAAERHIEIR